MCDKTWKYGADELFGKSRYIHHDSTEMPAILSISFFFYFSHCCVQNIKKKKKNRNTDVFCGYEIKALSEMYTVSD